MIRVDSADVRSEVTVKLNQVVSVGVLPLMRKRFVEQVVAEHYGFVCVASSEVAPQASGQVAIPSLHE